MLLTKTINARRPGLLLICLALPVSIALPGLSKAVAEPEAAAGATTVETPADETLAAAGRAGHGAVAETTTVETPADETLGVARRAGHGAVAEATTVETPADETLAVARRAGHGAAVVIEVSERAPEISSIVDIDAWARATPPGAGAAAIYGVMVNKGDQPLALSKITSPLATRVMVHETWLDQDMMRMRHATLKLAPGQELTLAPGGLHIMLMGMKEPLLPGCIYDFSVHWADGRVSSHNFLTGSLSQSRKPTDISPCQQQTSRSNQ